MRIRPSGHRAVWRLRAAQLSVEVPVKIAIGDIYEDCAYHPVRCTESDGDSLTGISLIDGSSPRCCSIKHCGVRKLSQAEADELIAVFKLDGERGLMRLRGWREEAIDNFMKKWR